MTLIRYIFFDYFVGHVSATAAKIPSRPQMSSPKLLLQMRKLSHQLVRCFPLQPLDQPAYRYLWWDRHKQMQMIFRYMPFQDRHFMLPTDISNQISYSGCNFSRQRRTTILRRPYQMQMNLENCVRSASILLHSHTLPHRTVYLLKPSPKGEGFNPPRVGQ
jgi:hypothetical protein